ncbi:efflux RND transporter permease subunit, partial [Myxococcus xanthus]|uniref:efflux RND transporter permease subunit n=3 Tax=Myxococcus TaxID=32 RepID=UPI0020A5DD97
GWEMRCETGSNTTGLRRNIGGDSDGALRGMVPVAIGEGGDFRAPMGCAVIGGTLTSTLLTLLVIPAVYEILVDGRTWSTRMLRKLFRMKPPEQRPHVPGGGGGRGEPRPAPQARHD